MRINYYNELTELPALDRTRLGRWIEQVAASYGKRVGEISYIFCSDEKILEVNRQFLQHDYYTDIITFDYTQGDRIGGDLFISLDTVRSNSDSLGEPYERELLRIQIHGILHLCGLADKLPEERESMTVAEERALSLFEVASVAP